MASSPPFEVEDQTDEDFFDKLVSDDDDFTVPSLSSVPKLADGSDSDELKAFANLSIGEDLGGENRSETIGEDDKTSPADTRKEEKSSSLVSSSSLKTQDAIGLENATIGTEFVSDLTASKSSQNSDDVSGLNNGDIGTDGVCDLVGSNSSGGLGVKEVQWSAFNTDSLQNGATRFGSYSDLFGELGDGGNVGDNLNNEPNIVADQNQSAYLDNAHNSSQYQEAHFYGEQTADVQDLNSSQYWESLYPGWKYDQITGQWYQVDGYDATTNVQGSLDMAINDEKSQVSYLQQTAQSAVGTMPQNGKTENVTVWKQQDSQVGYANGRGLNSNQLSQATSSTETVSNLDQVSQENSEYPSHMIFDPQYPGWYYDTIAQEWRSLDSYNTSAQSTFEAENHLNQNGSHTSENDPTTHGAFSNQGQDHRWAGSFSNYNEQASNIWQAHSVAPNVATTEFGGSLQLDNHQDQSFFVRNDASHQNSYDYRDTISYNEKAGQVHNQGFFPPGNFTNQFNQPIVEQNEHLHTSNHYYNTQNVVSYSQQPQQSGDQFYAPAVGRSSAGRPPHALVAFGFGGKLIVMKDNATAAIASYGNQDPVGGSISVLNLTEVANGRTDASSFRTGAQDYFHTLCQQSYPGPLTGGNIPVKELNKWMDERIAHYESSDMDYRKGEVMRLLLSLLKIACQHYGKFRSPFGVDTLMKENDAPEVAVARLFASFKRNDSQFNEYGALAHCLQILPSEGQMRATAAEVQTLLVSGRKKEALCCAQEGQLWGPALVLAAQLGNQFYVDTVKQMALRQLVAGSPLRTLCLLIAGQPAEVFSAEASDGGISSTINLSQPPAQLGANGMLDAWQENLAVITANRTKDDELVLIHLGDCLWKERSNIIAAHICYLVAEANFEPYSDSARLCLVGADHFKFPRTYVSPEAIQMTEIYECSKLLGNSQFILQPFQPYKLVYAYMLAEVGRVSDSLKYCQAVTRSLKTGRAPEVETWRLLASSLEDRIKTHQQGGFSTNLAPVKLVGKLLNLFDSTAHRVVGGLPPPAPSTIGSVQSNEHYDQTSGLQVTSSQSTMAMSTLMPSASMEPISAWTADSNKRTMPNRSVSEPDIGRTPRQDKSDSSKEASSANSQGKGKASISEGTSRFGRFGFGSQFLQKILKPRQDKQAKLGETNKFYYDEKLKRWVEEGVDPPAEEAALPPPPTTATFQNTTSDYNASSAIKSEASSSSGSPEYRTPTSSGHSAGIPPIPPPSSNQFSARGRMGVRSRYVDTFNKGGGNPTNLFQSPPVPINKPVSNANPKFFVPTPLSSAEQPLNTTSDGIEQSKSGNENPAVSTTNDSFQSFPMPPTHNMQRFASMDNISNKGITMTGTGSGSLSSHARRTASWSGSFDEAFSPPSRSEIKPLGEVLGTPPSSSMPNNPPLTQPLVKAGSYREDLHEVEL